MSLPMTLRDSLKLAGRAARTNLRPGLVLWALLVVFLAAWELSAGFRAALQAVADLKARSGYPFGFVSYALSAALLPELLRVVFFQHWRVTARNAHNLWFGALVWGLHGVSSDWFYRLQAQWFGAGGDWLTLAEKVAADQFGYSFVENGWILVVFAWRDAGFARRAWRDIGSVNFLLERYVPLMVAVWCVWIPGTAVVYFMPTALQLPVAALLTCFWALIFTCMSRNVEST
jgi:hypothetical protein